MAALEKKGWFGRLKEGLSRSAGKLSDRVSSVFTGKRRLDDETLQELEDALIEADLGPATAARLTAAVAEGRYGKEIGAEEVRELLADEVAAMLAPVAQAIEIDSANRPHVILVVGVNGSGKTTTIGKLAAQLIASGERVMLAAGDTFRAAAVEQLQIWGARVGAPVVSGREGADASGLVYDALTRARAEGMNVLLVDTAGRLQNKTGLMAELEKIRRVMKKIDPGAPHSTLLVLDATTGQNAVRQAEVFQDIAGVDGIVMTKLDGTARGGVLVAIARAFSTPIHAVGVGEGVEDLRPFDPMDFARALVGLDQRR